MPTPEEIASEQERLYESSSLRDDLSDAEATVLLKWGEAQVVHMANTFPDDFEKKARFLRQLLKNINRFVGQREFNDKAGQRDYMSKVVKYLEPLGYSADEETLFAVLPDNPKDMMANLKAIITILTPEPTITPDDTPPDLTATDEQEMPVITDDNSDAAEADNLTDDERNKTDEQIMPAITDEQELKTTNYRHNIDKTEVLPDVSHLIDDDDDHELNYHDDSYHHNINTTEDIPTLDYPTTETGQVGDSETLENPDAHSINQADTEDTTGTGSNDVTTDE